MTNLGVLWCGSCKQWLEAAAFNRKHGSRHGRQNRCRNCQSKRAAAYYRKCVARKQAAWEDAKSQAAKRRHEASYVAPVIPEPDVDPIPAPDMTAVLTPDAASPCSSSNTPENAQNGLRELAKRESGALCVAPTEVPPRATETEFPRVLETGFEGENPTAETQPALSREVTVEDVFAPEVFATVCAEMAFSRAALLDRECGVIRVFESFRVQYDKLPWYRRALAWLGRRIGGGR